MYSFAFRRLMSTVLVLSMIAVTIPAPAQAAMIATADATSRSEDRQRISAFLERGEVAAKLETYGVSPADANARIAALSDDEVSALARRIDDLPAGGFIGDIVGALVLVFLVLLLTDILGYTKVFPFTHSVNRK